MLLYSGKVRLQGSLNNEVRKTDITAPEIAILQRIHGKDAVVDVVKVGAVKNRTDRSERHRLANTYPIGPSADGKSRLSGETFVDSVLGVGNTLATEYVPPVDMKAEDAVPEEEEEIVHDNAPVAEEVEEVVDEQAPVRTRVPRAPRVVAPQDPLEA